MFQFFPLHDWLIQMLCALAFKCNVSLSMY